MSLDGKPVVEVRDTTYRSGSPGLAVTKGVTLFKDIQVKVLRGEEEIATSSQEPAKIAGSECWGCEGRGRLRASHAKTTVSRPAKIPGVQSWSVELAGHQGMVQAIAWSPKGDLIATGCWHGSVRLWDREGRLQKVLLGHEGASLLSRFLAGRIAAGFVGHGGLAVTYQMRVFKLANRYLLESHAF